MKISRRDFSTTMLASLVGAGMTGLGRVQGATATNDERDRFGGWKGRKFKATGYFLDVFAPEFAAHCGRLAKQIAAPLQDDPFLLGYAMTDCPLFTEEDCRERPDTIGGPPRASRIGFPRRLRNLGPAAPGKQAYVRTVRKHYRDHIEDFNTTYGTTFNSFDALAAAVDWRTRTELSNASERRLVHRRQSEDRGLDGAGFPSKVTNNPPPPHRRRYGYERRLRHRLRRSPGSLHPATPRNFVLSTTFEF
jgi:hypothetical protein